MKTALQLAIEHAVQQAEQAMQAMQAQRNSDAFQWLERAHIRPSASPCGMPAHTG